MTIDKAIEKYSTVDGAIEYITELLKQDTSDNEVGSAPWVFFSVLRTIKFNLRVLKIYKKKYGKLPTVELPE